MATAPAHRTGTSALASRISGRWRDAWRNALASCVAAPLAWTLAQHLFGHPQPLFAAIAAIVCLAPGLPSYSKQALGVLLGVTTGVAIGEFALILPDGAPVLKIGAAALVAILVAVTYGLPPVVPIQAAVSAVLVVTLGPATGGSVRMMDVLVGTTIGLVFSQIFLPPNPLRAIEHATSELLAKLASGFGTSAAALREHDSDKADAALGLVSVAHESVAELDAGIAAASNAAWSLRRRLTPHEIDQIIARRDGHAIRLLASALLFASDVTSTLKTETDRAPAGLCQRVQRLADTCASMAKDEPAIPEDQIPAGAVTPPWRSVGEHLNLVETAVAAFAEALSPPSSIRLKPHR